MASSVGHVRQSLPFDVLKILLNSHAVDISFIDLIEVRDELLAGHNHSFLENGDLLLARVRSYC